MNTNLFRNKYRVSWGNSEIDVLLKAIASWDYDLNPGVWSESQVTKSLVEWDCLDVKQFWAEQMSSELSKLSRNDVAFLDRTDKFDGLRLSNSFDLSEWCATNSSIISESLKNFLLLTHCNIVSKHAFIVVLLRQFQQSIKQRNQKSRVPVNRGRSSTNQPSPNECCCC